MPRVVHREVKESAQSLSGPGVHRRDVPTDTGLPNSAASAGAARFSDRKFSDVLGKE